MGSENAAVTWRTSLTVPRGERVTRRGSAPAVITVAQSTSTDARKGPWRARGITAIVTSGGQSGRLLPLAWAHVEGDGGERPGEVVELVDLHGEGDAFGELAGRRAGSVRHRRDPERVEDVAVAPHAGDLGADRLQLLAEDGLVRPRDDLGQEVRVLALDA